MNPYKELPAHAFWKLAVASKDVAEIDRLWDPRFKILPAQKVVTFGSCFAQHIGRALKSRGFSWLCTETPPNGLTDEGCQRFNYNVFSARTGNIYTASLLRQWTEWSLGKKSVPGEVWQQNGRYIDPFRPRIEPEGFESIDELQGSRQEVLAAFKAAIQKASYFVFTLGLTESWFHRKKKYEYPMCPGTVAGDFDATAHQFVNQRFDQVYGALEKAFALIRRANPKIRFILTVSPVPLTATKSGRHVIVATMASKSILRAVADQMTTEYEDVDYFPSYEIINSPVFQGAFFDANKRTVSPGGVGFVMDRFFQCLVAKYGSDILPNVTAATVDPFDEVCEEALLEAFGGEPK